MTVYDIEAHREDPPTGTKLTAARLAEVEEIQKQMRAVTIRLARLAEEENNGWVPGSPQTERTHRVEPISGLVGEVEAGIALLERLYS
jgi:hypothetical protein